MKVQLVFTKTCIYCGATKRMWSELQKKYNFDYEEIEAETPKGQELTKKFSIMSSPTTIIDDKIAFTEMPNSIKAEEAVRI